jgi:hypothetical protein
MELNMFITYPYAKFHTSSSSGSLLIPQNQGLILNGCHVDTSDFIKEIPE